MDLRRLVPTPPSGVLKWYSRILAIFDFSWVVKIKSRNFKRKNRKPVYQGKEWKSINQAEEKDATGTHRQRSEGECPMPWSLAGTHVCVAFLR